MRFRLRFEIHSDPFELLFGINKMKLFRSQFKIAGVVIACVLLYDEYIGWWLPVLKWPRFAKPSDDQTVLLLVADPQIFGDRDDDSPLSPLYTWDCDRYLRRTFERVSSRVRPDAIVFLGDMMNEGAVVSKEEYKRNVRRLSSIFAVPYPVKRIWIPGDNDIGGENRPIYPERVKMFDDAFGRRDVVVVKSVNVFKVNGLTQTFPKMSNSAFPANGTNIVISHVPLLLSPGRFTGKVLTKIHPVVVFSGHKHAAFHLETTLDTMFVSKVIAMTPQDNEGLLEIERTPDTYHEFIVPTCSYRMGVPNMGYGVLIMEKSKFSYTILWSPRRYEQLIVYAIIVLSVLLYLITISILKAISVFCRNVQYSKV